MYKLYQQLISAMAGKGITTSDNIDVIVAGVRKTLTAVLGEKAPLPAVLTDNKQYVMRNGKWVEVQIATDAESITYSGDITSAANVKAAIDALAADSVIAQQLKAAIGDEVSNVWPRAFAIGELAWHSGKLYRVTNATVADDPWDAIDVAETTLSDEINALRGISSESVYLTIQPTSAIPQAGVTARIYNIKTQTYMAEETILPSANRVHLGDVPFGDDYTIIMPSIDGYTQPADQTFKAGQMIRERTVTYVADSSAEYETVTIKATKSNSAAIGECSVTVSVYDGNGNVAQTITLNLEGGTCEAFQLPLGTRYRVTFPDISGFLTPRPLTFTAALKQRTFSCKYVIVPSSQYRFVTTDFEYLDMDADLTEVIATGKLLGVAFMTSTLLANGGAYIYVLYSRTINGVSLPRSQDQQSGNYWSNPNVDVPQAVSTYNGQQNTVNAYQTILQYEQDNDVTVQSIFKDLYAAANTLIEVDGVEYRCFIPTRAQIVAAADAASQINQVLAYYGLSETVAGTTLGDSYSRQTSSTAAECQGGANYNSKTTLYYGSRPRYVLPII